MALFNRFNLALHDAEQGRVLPYMDKFSLPLPDWRILGRAAGGTLRLHHFHQGEPETDSYHDHEYDFITFPLASYQEGSLDSVTGWIEPSIVPARRFTYREATGLHVVWGRWHPAKYGTGALNKYRGFWTIVLGLKPRRQFYLVRFVHPEGLSYDEVIALDNWAEVRPYWMTCLFDPTFEVVDGAAQPMERLFTDEFIAANPLPPRPVE